MYRKIRFFFALLFTVTVFGMFGTVCTYAKTDDAKYNPVGQKYKVNVESGYLAIRYKKEYDDSNELGKLYNDDIVTVLETDDTAYDYVYSSRLGCRGYVNKNFIIPCDSDLHEGDGKEEYTVDVASGYLALRTAPAYDDTNEIGKLETGDTVELIEKSFANYWYVYSAKDDKCGYVNCNYLYNP